MPVVADIGSGLIDANVPWLKGAPPAWLAGEPAELQEQWPAHDPDGAGVVPRVDERGALLGGRLGVVGRQRALLEHGLAHEPSCFRFWESKRPVLTPSATQVRQPMTEKSISSGQRYEPFIQPHIPALAEITRKARDIFKLA